MAKRKTVVIWDLDETLILFQAFADSTLPCMDLLKIPPQQSEECRKLGEAIQEAVVCQVFSRFSS